MTQLDVIQALKVEMPWAVVEAEWPEFVRVLIAEDDEQDYYSLGFGFNTPRGREARWEWQHHVGTRVEHEGSLPLVQDPESVARAFSIQLDAVERGEPRHFSPCGSAHRHTILSDLSPAERAHFAVVVEAIKAEILENVRAGYVPADVGSWGDLSEFIDTSLCGESAFEWPTNPAESDRYLSRIVFGAQDSVCAWLSSGALLQV